MFICSLPGTQALPSVLTAIPMLLVPSAPIHALGLPEHTSEIVPSVAFRVSYWNQFFSLNKAEEMGRKAEFCCFCLFQRGSVCSISKINRGVAGEGWAGRTSLGPRMLACPSAQSPSSERFQEQEGELPLPLVLKKRKTKTPKQSTPVIAWNSTSKI